MIPNGLVNLLEESQNCNVLEKQFNVEITCDEIRTRACGRTIVEPM